MKAVVRGTRGMSLLETLTAVSVIALLASLLLPAVQYARSTAQSAGCKAKLRQIAAAVHAYHDVHRLMPSPLHAMNDGPPHTNLHQYLSIQAFLLPYLERPDVYDLMNMERRLVYSLYGELNHEQATAASVPVGAFVCPADGETRVFPSANSYRANQGIGPYWSMTAETPDSDNGFFGVSARQGRQMARISDGLSQTAMFSERLVGEGERRPRPTLRAILSLPEMRIHRLGTGDMAVQWCAGLSTLRDVGQFESAGSQWIITGMHHTTYTHAQTPNEPIPDCQTFSAQPPIGISTARSAHPGLVNVAFGDGSVRSVGNGVEKSLWRAIATRAGGEVVQKSEL